MGIYRVLLAIFHVTVLVHTGNSCTVQIESDKDFVLLGQTAELNCTSNCTDLYWETRLTKLSTNKSNYFSSVQVRVSDWADSPVQCLAESDDGTIYKDEVTVIPYALPSRVDIDLKMELEEDKEHEVTCWVDDVAPVKYVILSVTRGGEIFLSRTYERDTRRGPQNLTERFKFTASRSDNLEDFACQVTLNLTRVTNTTDQSSPITVRTYGNSCTVQIESDKDFVLLGQTAQLNCTSNCKDLFWESRLTKLSLNKSNYFSSVQVRVSDWADSPIQCLAESDDGTIYKDEVTVIPYALPSRVDIDLKMELEEGKEHEVTCSVYDVAPVKYVILSVTRGGEIFLSRTYEGDTRRGPQNLMETFKIMASRGDNVQDFACHITLNLTRATKITVQLSPITARTYEPNPKKRKN